MRWALGPGWLGRRHGDPASGSAFARRQRGPQRRTIPATTDPTRYVHLIDGGVADNLALRGAGATMQTIAQAPESFGASGLNRIRRVLVLSIDGQGAQDTSVGQHRVVGGMFSIFRLVAGTQIDRFNFRTLAVVDQQLQEFVGRSGGRGVPRQRRSTARAAMMWRARWSMFRWPGFPTARPGSNFFRSALADPAAGRCRPAHRGRPLRHSHIDFPWITS